MLSSDAELRELVDTWTHGTLPAKDWTHAAHLATCSYLAWNHALANTYRLMKDGLHRHLESSGTPTTEERGYHETLTRFWCTLLFFKIHRGHYSSSVLAANAMIGRYGDDARAERPYYSFDVMKSKEARRIWIAPDVPGEVALEAFRW